MTAGQPDGSTQAAPRDGRLCRWWGHILDLALTIWVVRVPFIALLAGLLLLSFVPQAQDLMVELAPDIYRVAQFLILLVIWVAVTTYASFLALETDGRFLQHVEQRQSAALNWMRLLAPFALGAMPFVIVSVAIVRSYWNLPDIPDKDYLDDVKAALGWLMFAVAVLCAIFVYCRTKCPPFVTTALAYAERVARRIDGRLRARLWGLSFRVDTGLDHKKAHYFGPLVLAIVSLVSVVIMWFGPNIVAGWLPRALIVPVVLGGWLPLLIWLSAAGRRFKAPLITGGLLLLAVLSALLGDNHSVRRIAGADVAEQPGSEVSGKMLRTNTPPMTLNQAVNLWMAENDCPGQPEKCPRPIIVAAAGGASRAGFFTASVIGQLLDQAALEGPGTRIPNQTNVRKRLFAISGVSGSSVGAVMSVAAMARAGAPTKQPCAVAEPALWYGRKINTWRDCLEALMAGDFLTPAVIGLIFNDRISFGWWQDRAAVLEQAWEDRYATIMKISDFPKSCPGDLRCPFMTLQPASGLWVPLLVLNGTSAATGRRIITSTLTPNYIARICPTVAATENTIATQNRASTKQTYVSDTLSGTCELFLETNRFHSLLTSSTKPNFLTQVQLWFRWEYLAEKLPFIGVNRVLDDVRLSTAAHNSARFPIISPPGAVRNLEHQVIDRIVDGGYIENYGALTAMELAQAIHAIHPMLAPFVLTVSNDPDDDPDLNPLDAPDSAFLSDLVIPIEAFASVRTGRGRLAVKQVEAVLDHLAEPACGAQTAHLRVWPQLSVADDGKKTSRPVSMSWWLSQPIQIHLHQQTEPKKDQQTEPQKKENQPELDKIWNALVKPEACRGRAMVPSAVDFQRPMSAPR